MTNTPVSPRRTSEQLTLISLPLDILEHIVFSLSDAMSFKSLGASHRVLRDFVMHEHIQVCAKIHFLRQVVKIERPASDGSSSVVEYQTVGSPLPQKHLKEMKIQTLGRKRKRILAEDTRTIQKIESVSEIDGRRMIYHILPNRVKHGIYKEWYPGGKQLRRRTVFWEGKEDGVSYLYHPNGQLWRQASYTQGRLDGEYKSWYNDGTLEVSTRYADEKRIGSYLEWYKSGKLYASGEYSKYGEKQGDFELWYESGARMSVKQYDSRGEKIGVWRDWYENGQLSREKVYRADHRVISETEWTPDGKVR